MANIVSMMGTIANGGPTLNKHWAYQYSVYHSRLDPDDVERTVGNKAYYARRPGEHLVTERAANYIITSHHMPPDQNYCKYNTGMANPGV